MSPESGLYQWIPNDKRSRGKVNILHALLIRRLAAEGNKYADVGAMFGLSQSYVSHTVQGILHTKVPGHQWFFDGWRQDAARDYEQWKNDRSRRDLLSATHAFWKVKKWLKTSKH